MTTSAQGDNVILATTTSLIDSGLLDYLLPAFERRNGCRVWVLAVGSGAAIRHGRDGNADLVLAHDPESEKQAMAQGFFEERRPILGNDFVIVGPRDDPAGISGASSAAESLRRIAVKKIPFVSRSDHSGTHHKELELWTRAGQKPRGSWYIESGGGMAQALRLAGEKKAYCLTDRATFLVQGRRSNLVVLFENSDHLINPYHGLLVSQSRHPKVRRALAKKLLEFLASPQAQAMIAAYGTKEYGRPLFYPAARLDKER